MSEPMAPLPDGYRNITTLYDLTPEQRSNVDIVGGLVLRWVWKPNYKTQIGDPMPEGYDRNRKGANR